MTTQEAINKFFDHVIEWEGVYGNDPDDHGGETKRGVTWATYQTIAPKLGIDPSYAAFLKMDVPTQKRFIKYFWDWARASEMDPSIGAFITQFKWGGAARIPMFLNQIFKEQGIKDKIAANAELSDKNIKSINSIDTVLLFDRLHQLRVAHHIKRAETVAGQAKFKNGWINRANAFYKIFYPKKKS